MKNIALKVAASAVAGCLMAALPAFASNDNQLEQGQAVITVLPAKNAPNASVTQQDLSLKVNGKATNITGIEPLQGPNSKIQMVVLIDDGARASLSNQMKDIANFIRSLPPNASVTVGYMQNGQALLTGPLTTNHEQVVKSLHITEGVPGVNASPYFCLSNLVKNWPSSDADARREVVMITDGVDYYDLGYDPYDPYVHSAINNAVTAHVIVYSIYWKNTPRIDRSWYETNAGQNLLAMVTDATGGNSYWIGMGDPVSLAPFLDNIRERLDNQYELSFMAPPNTRYPLANFKLRTNNGTKIDAPQQVVLTGGNGAGGQ